MRQALLQNQGLRGMFSSAASCSGSKGLQAKKRPPASSVGTLRLPSLARITISSADSSSSMFTSRNATPRSFKKDFARRQSGHHWVVYIVMDSILDAIDGRAAALPGDLDANEGALERNAGAVPIDVGIARRQTLLGARASSVRASEIDLVGELGGFRKHRDAVR